MTTTPDDVWQILAELATAQAELTASQAELTAAQKKTDKQLKKLGQQIGGLGAKFGGFSEHLALPSMEPVLRKQFGIQVLCPSLRVQRKGEKEMRIDVLAYAGDPINTAYIVEVKSHATEESITQLKDILKRFRTLLPEHKDKKLYGILAAVDLSNAVRKKILKEGFYVARIHNEVFELDIPDNFQPQLY